MNSSYLEGQKNFFGAFGYNRDKKRGKKQIVVGLLCDESGDPASVAVFYGNTPDMSTSSPRILKIADQFGCMQVTVVGDLGIVKSAQIDQLPQGIHYITAITRPQIDKLIVGGIIHRWGCLMIVFVKFKARVFAIFCAAILEHPLKNPKPGLSDQAWFFEA